jgi:hypothetical protein
MKRKAAVTASLLASSLLLAGCEVPTSVEELTGWRDRFFIQVELDQILAWIDNPVFSIIEMIGTLALVMVLLGLTANMLKNRSLWSGNVGFGMGIMLSIIVLVLHFSITTTLGKIAFPPDLTSDRVLQVLQLELSLDIADIALAAYAVNLLFAVPIVHSLWQVVMLPKAIISVVESVASRSWTPLYVMLGQIMGWLIFPWIFYLYIELLGVFPPVIFDPVKWVLNGSFILVLLYLWWLCYFKIPSSIERKIYQSVPVAEAEVTPAAKESDPINFELLAALLAAFGIFGRRQPEAESNTTSNYGGWRSIPQDALPPGPTPAGPRSGGSPGGSRARAEDNVVEGEYREAGKDSDNSDAIPMGGSNVIHLGGSKGNGEGKNGNGQKPTPKVPGSDPNFPEDPEIPYDPDSLPPSR